MAVGDTHVFPGFFTPVLTQISFQNHRLLFSHDSAEMRGENTPEINSASTGSQTHNYQVMSPTCSPLSHPGGINTWTGIQRRKIAQNERESTMISDIPTCMDTPSILDTYPILSAKATPTGTQTNRPNLIACQ